MAQTKYLSRDGIKFLDSHGWLNYDASAAPAYIACGKAREIARATVYAEGDLVIKPITSDATLIYHVYECTTPGTSHATTIAAGFATGAALKHPSTTEITDGTAGFTFSYTPDQGQFVAGAKQGRYIVVRNGVFYDRYYSNNEFHKTDGYAYAEYTGGNGSSTFVRGSMYVNGLQVLENDGTSFVAPPAPVALIAQEDLMAIAGYDPTP